MKKKLLKIGMIICAGLIMTSCGSEEKTTYEKASDDAKTENKVEEDNEADVEEYDGYSLQDQWDDIVFQVSTGLLSNLDMYVDFKAPMFSEEEWNYIDLSYPEYNEAFSSFSSFEELPAADHFAMGARVVEVYFETVEEGMTFESMVMFYLENRNGLLWIIGVEMAG